MANPLAGFTRAESDRARRYHRPLGAASAASAVPGLAVARPRSAGRGPDPGSAGARLPVERERVSVARAPRSSFRQTRRSGLPPKEDKIEVEGEVVEALRNSMFRVMLDNGHETLGYAAGKMRRYRIKVFPGDRVRVELSPYDLTRGRIVYRYR